jgi:hypothetical protein
MSRLSGAEGMAYAQFKKDRDPNKPRHALFRSRFR